MRVAIYGRLLDSSNIPYIQQLIDELKKAGIDFTIFDKYLPHLLGKVNLPADVATFSNHKEIRKSVDYIFSIGGDGTLLDTVTLVRDSGIPVLGINMGRLGFLSSIGKEEIKLALHALKNNTYVIDKRDLLHLDSNEPLFGEVDYALNEITVMKRDSASMIIVHAYLNGEFLNSYWADGLIVATPTGSTAYNLSCGGPVIFPFAKSMVITPIAPHHLNVRPLVVPDSSVISFEIEGRQNNFICTLDSRREDIDSSYQLAIKKESFTLNLVRLSEKNFLATLRSKLLWGFDKRND